MSGGKVDGDVWLGNGDNSGDYQYNDLHDGYANICYD